MTLYEVLIAVVHGALLGIGIWLIVIDLRTHRLPNRIVLPTLAALILLVIVEAGVTGGVAPAIRAGIGMLLLGGFYAVLHLWGRDGMGGGDVKLAAVIGLLLAWHGWTALAVGAASAFVFGALYALVLMALRRADRSTRIAFGPWMIAGAVIGIAMESQAGLW